MMIFLLTRRRRLRILKPNQSLLPTRRRFGFSSSSLISSSVDQSFVKQIRYLLQINHEPLVKIQQSNIPGAGTGVFYYNNSSNKEHQHYYPQQVVCLYPGVYTPGMPIAISTIIDDDDENLEFIKDQYYIANKIIPPSGISFEDNAYIINLPFGQGYIDGCALEVDNNENEETAGRSSRRRRLLNENPSACGHLVNHRSSSTNSNVQLISFFWDEIIDYYCCNSHYFQLPNTIRNDGMEWYYDPITKDIVRFPTTTHNIDDSHHASSSPKMRLRGVAMVLNKPVKSGEELFLDYGLIGPPYPNWARDWYKS